PIAGAMSRPGDHEDRALDTVKALLEAGSDVNAANGAGDTALHGAAASGYTRVIQLLVERGATVDAENKKGQTPLAMTATAARGVDKKKVADVLLRLGVKK